MLVITDNLEKLKLEFHHLKWKASQIAILSTIYRETHTQKEKLKRYTYTKITSITCVSESLNCSE